MDRFTLSLREALTRRLMRGFVATLVCVLTFGQLALATTAERGELYLRFKSAFEAGDWASAEERATALVNLIESSENVTPRELVNPLTNLGTVAFRRGNIDTAIEHYQRAIKLIDGEMAGADSLLIRPLHGLGESLLAKGLSGEAAIPLKRAVDLSRNVDGLFNQNQIDIVDALIEAYVATGQLTDAEREHQYAFRIAETAFGKNDLRLLEPLDRYARWFESIGRYSTARGLHSSALQMAERQSADKPIVGVAALRGLARTWLLEGIYGPEVEPETAIREANEASGPFLSSAGAGRLNADGERALKFALNIISETKPRDSQLFAETLVQFGDWYLIAGSTQRAHANYLEAEKVLAEIRDSAGTVRLLDNPRLLVYRAPAASITRLKPEDPTQYSLHDIEFALDVGPDGKVVDAKVISSTAPEATTRAALLAARKARYGPRVAGNEVVAASGITLREKVWVRAAQSKN
ncbi:MAG: tetratricopeptide repeat protein [Steroidobacteraceae bacterium]